MKYFVTAIGTDSGKTIVSAILAECLGADYWKPIQSGLPRDTETVAGLVSGQTGFFAERHMLHTPASPHASARIDGVQIEVSDFEFPDTDKDLVIEGAGGLMVPINDEDLMIDLIPRLADEVILVCNLYLGSINHSLLSIEALKSRNIKVKGIIFNGETNEESENVILNKSGWPCLLRIKQEEVFDQQTVSRYAQILAETWK